MSLQNYILPEVSSLPILAILKVFLLSDLGTPNYSILKFHVFFLKNIKIIIIFKKSIFVIALLDLPPSKIVGYQIL